MKKLSTTFLALCAVVFSSCLDTKIEIPPTAGGAMIYDYAGLQNRCFFYPINYAFRVGVLVAEMEKNPGVTPGEITVKVDEKDENLMKLLFPDTNVTATRDSENSQIWNVTDKGDYSGNGGTFIINTYGKQIGEMGAAWNITLPTENGKLKPFVVSNLAIEFSQISIYCTIDNNSWSLSTSELNVYSSGQTDKMGMSKWTPDFNLKQSSGDQTYNSMKVAQFEISGSAQGNPTGFTEESKFKYQIEYSSPLKYKYCTSDYYKRHIIVRGQEIVTADFLPLIDPQNYPSGRVTVTWNESSDCKPYYELHYNGETASSKQE